MYQIKFKRAGVAILSILGVFLGSFVAAQAATFLFPGGGGTGWGYPGGLQAHTVIIGEGVNAVATATPSNAGYVLTSNGVNADPSFQASTGGGSSFSYPFPSNATSTTLIFNNGLISTASSTFTNTLFLNTASSSGDVQFNTAGYPQDFFGPTDVSPIANVELNSLNQGNYASYGIKINNGGGTFDGALGMDITDTIAGIPQYLYLKNLTGAATCLQITDNAATCLSDYNGLSGLLDTISPTYNALGTEAGMTTTLQQSAGNDAVDYGLQNYPGAFATGIDAYQNYYSNVYAQPLPEPHFSFWEQANGNTSEASTSWGFFGATTTISGANATTTSIDLGDLGNTTMFRTLLNPANATVNVVSSSTKAVAFNVSKNTAGTLTTDFSVNNNGGASSTQLSTSNNTYLSTSGGTTAIGEAINQSGATLEVNGAIKNLGSYDQYSSGVNNQYYFISPDGTNGFETGAYNSSFVSLEVDGSPLNLNSRATNNVNVGSASNLSNLNVFGTASTSALKISSITGSTQCLKVDSLGNVLGTGSACDTNAGTVTSIATNNGLTGGTITGSGTIGLAALGSAGVLGAPTASVPTVQATSTLYGNGTGGQVLAWNNGQPQWVATSSITSASSTLLSDSNTFSGATTTITTVSESWLDGVANTLGFGGVDIGAKVNAAYASCPASGCQIKISDKYGQTYNFSTEIAATTSGKPLLLTCDPGITLNYTGSATSTVINDTNVAGGQFPQNHGVIGCNYTHTNTGAGDTSVAIELGGTNGAPNVQVANTHIYGFGKAVTTGNNTWLPSFTNNVWEYDTQAFIAEGTSNAGENFDFNHDTVSDCVTLAKCMYFPNSSSASITIESLALDDAQLYIEDGNDSVVWTGGHIENPAVYKTGAYVPIVFAPTGSNGYSHLSVNGVTVYNDATTTGKSFPMAILSGSRVTLNGITTENDHSIAMPALVGFVNTGEQSLTYQGIVAAANELTTIATSSVDFGVNSTGIGHASNPTITSNIPFDGITVNTASGDESAQNVGFAVTANGPSQFINTNSTLTVGSAFNFVNSVNGSTPIFTITGGGGADLLQAIGSAGTVLDVQNGGRVGIGSSTPNSALVVANSNPIITLDNQTGNLITLADSGGAFTLNTVGTAHSINFAQNGTNAMEILANGNVGIGTSSPNTNLNIGGNVYIGAPTAGGSLGNLTVAGLATPAGTFLAANAQGQIIATTSPSAGGSGTVTSIATNNGLTGGTITTSGTIGLAAISQGVLGNSGSASAVPTSIATSTLFAGATGSVGYFASSGGLVGTSTITIAASGNVGVGSTTPFALLSIGGANAGVDISTASSTFYNNQFYSPVNLTAVPNMYFGNGTDANDWLITSAGGRGMIWYTTGDAGANEAFTFAGGSGKGVDLDVNCTNNTFKSGCTQAFNILSNGFIGIATTTPFATLSVVSNSGTAPIFAVATTTTQGLPSFEIDNNGYLVLSGPKGNLTSCGTTNSLSGNDQAGTIMFTGTAVTACTLNFAVTVPAGQTVSCTATDNSLVGFSDISATTTTSVTFGISAGLTTGTIYYRCQRYQ